MEVSVCNISKINQNNKNWLFITLLSYCEILNNPCENN